MPEIPKATGNTVRTAPLPAVMADPRMASPDAFGASIAQGLQRGADMAYRAQREAEDDRDDIEAVDALNQFAEADHQRMADYRNRTGGDARGLLDEAGNDYRKRQDEASAKLSRPGAKLRFKQMTDQRWSNRNSAILAEHQADQIRRYESSTLDSSVKRAHLDALDVGTDDALVEADRMGYLNRQRQADLMGTDPATLDLAARADRDALFSAAIEQDIEGDNWKGAQARLEKFGASMSKDKRMALESRIRDGGRNQTAQDTTDTIFRSGYATTKADADRMVAAIPDADLRGRTQTKVDHEWARRQAALAEVRGSKVEALSKAIEAGEDVEALLAKDENHMALEQSDRDNLRLTARRAALREEPPQGSDSYYGLRNMAAVAPQAFIREDLRLWRGKINETERQQMIEHQADLRGALKRTTEKGAKPARGFMTSEAIANDTLRGMGINPGVEDGKIDPRALAFKTGLDRAIAASGGDDALSADQVRAIAGRMVAEETRTVSAGGVGRWTNTIGLGLPGLALGIGKDSTEQVRSFEAPGADRRAFSVGQIPAGDLEAARQALKAHSKDPDFEPTEDQVLSTYNATISRQAP